MGESRQQRNAPAGACCHCELSFLHAVTSDDEEFEQLLPTRTRTKIVNYVSVVHRYDDLDFKAHFRLTRTAFQARFHFLSQFGKIILSK